MIFVTLGTQDKVFPRLLMKIDELIEKKVIQEEVIVQAGFTKYVSKNMKILEYVDKAKFNQYVSESSILITHGGVGSILTGITRETKVIAVPRLQKYKEHVNDHQVEIVKHFASLNYIIGCLTVEQLEDSLSLVDDFKAISYKGNNKAFCELIFTLINED